MMGKISLRTHAQTLLLFQVRQAHINLALSIFNIFFKKLREAGEGP